MITFPTTLILGAGASVEYNFPTGQKLRDEIIKFLRDKSRFASSMTAQLWDGPKYDHVKAFLENFEGAQTRSIDQWLQINPSYQKIGKALIAEILIECEDRTFIDNQGDHWYRYLWDSIRTKSFEDLANNQLSIITFNYDKSLEEYLYSVIRSTYTDIREEDVISFVTNLDIVHTHGVISDLIWERKFSDGHYYSSDNREKHRLEHAIKSILIPDIDAVSIDTRKIASDYIHQSDRIVFLGFGYHQENLDILDLPLIPGRNTYLGTGYNLPPREIKRIREYFEPAKIQLGAPDVDIIRYLQSIDFG